MSIKDQKDQKDQNEQVFPSIGMGPGVWGPIFWTMLHITTLGYPDFPSDAEKHGAIAFFESLQYTLPCPICKQHYAMNLKLYPVEQAVGSKQQLIRWLFVVHNEVNKQLQKSQVSWDTFIQNMSGLSKKSAISFSDICSQRSVFSIENLLYVSMGLAVGATATMGISYILHHKKA